MGDLEVYRLENKFPVRGIQSEADGLKYLVDDDRKGVIISGMRGKTGVYWRKDTSKWTAEIKHLGKKHCLGCFDSFEEAARSRDLAEEKYMKGFRPSR